jgi:Zn-dependent M16 (insulinase) family peptidase
MKNKSGEELTHEDVVNMLDDETVSYSVGLGLAGQFPENLRISIKVEKGSYPQAVAWIRDLVYGSKFDIERWVCLLCRLSGG